ncbi:6-pyruvoyltetrahydropterin/6-carboxytetrahydropterin synthase [Pseudonocardia autotrophica]|nr:6-pyruvoyltetrahydropterin/6-carboxytetrahydropterin synthase [Pseudonocardia autotrophica]
MSILRRYSFEAAHRLSWHPGKCRALHGHRYVMEVEATGPVDERGVVADFAELDAQVEQHVLARLDHSYLNDLLNNPTAELTACMIGDWLSEAAVPWTMLRLWETERGSVVLRRPS